MKEFQAQIELKEGAIPKFHKARPVPYALKEGVEKELDRLETAGVVPRADGKEHGNADFMSRAPFEEAKCHIEAEVNDSSHTNKLPITAKEIAECTRKDKILARVFEYTLSETQWMARGHE